MPSWIILTAIAARNNTITLEATFTPLLPKKEATLFACQNSSQAIARLAINETNTMNIEYCPESIINVVKTAGPTTSGVPRGTAPIKSVSEISLSFMILPITNSLAASKKRIKPPATANKCKELVKMLPETFDVKTHKFENKKRILIYGLSS